MKQYYVVLSMLQVMMKLKAEINILDRNNARLRGEKTADTAKIDDLSKQVSADALRLSQEYHIDHGATTSPRWQLMQLAWMHG